jgi:ribonuclease HI
MTVEIIVYSDGSGNTFDSDGGYGFRMLVDGIQCTDGSGYLKKATNNVAELQAAIKGLECAKAYMKSYSEVHDYEQYKTQYNVTLISDSQLVLGYASGKYMCKAIHLSTYYIKIRALHDELNITTKWERGHQGEPNNEAVDKLAGQARANKKGLDDV